MCDEKLSKTSRIREGSLQRRPVGLAFLDVNCVGMTKHPRDVARMIADVELIFDELNDFVSRSGLAVFE
jgi:hypothetical protein